MQDLCIRNDFLQYTSRPQHSLYLTFPFLFNILFESLTASGVWSLWLHCNSLQALFCQTGTSGTPRHILDQSRTQAKTCLPEEGSKYTYIHIVYASNIYHFVRVVVVEHCCRMLPCSPEAELKGLDEDERADYLESLGVKDRFCETSLSWIAKGSAKHVAYEESEESGCGNLVQATYRRGCVVCVRCTSVLRELRTLGLRTYFTCGPKDGRMLRLGN